MRCAAGLTRLESRSLFSASHLVLVDASLDELDAVLNATPDAIVMRFDAAHEDAGTVLARASAATGGAAIESIAIFSHGRSGGFFLGNSWIDQDALARDAGAWRTLASQLTGDATISIFGCDVAASDEGKALVAALAEMTGTDVFASTDLTGLGGDWELEYHVGDGVMNDGTTFDVLALADAQVTLITETVLDDFNAAVYTGNDGTQNWTAGWQELGEANGAGTGIVRVTGGAAQISGNLIDLTGNGLSREADLSGAHAATLTFDYQRSVALVGLTTVTLAVSGDGGATWNDLQTYTLNGNDATFVAQNFDITAFIASNTQVRFVAAGIVSALTTFSIDNVQISYEVNTAPVVNDQTFGIDENSAAATAAGTVVATDADAGDTRTFAITAGNTGGAFAIDTNTGQITVNTPAALDFETTPTFNLTVQVTDALGLTDTATITINLNDVNEAPVVNSQAFAIDENSAAAAVVGTVVSSDQDTGDTRTFAITAGNTGSAFAIDTNTGQITVNTPAALDFETTPTFNLTVLVTDLLGLTDTATITIDLNNVNEAPVVNNQAFAIDENSAAAAVVGTVVSSDQDTGDTRTFAITGGNAGGAFAMDTNTGQITVNDPVALDFETTPTFTLTVQVTDLIGLTDAATITINLNDLSEPVPPVASGTESPAPAPESEEPLLEVTLSSAAVSAPTAATAEVPLAEAPATMSFKVEVSDTTDATGDPSEGTGDDSSSSPASDESPAPASTTAAERTARAGAQPTPPAAEAELTPNESASVPVAAPNASLPAPMALPEFGVVPVALGNGPLISPDLTAGPRATSPSRTTMPAPIARSLPREPWSSPAYEAWTQQMNEVVTTQRAQTGTASVVVATMSVGYLAWSVSTSSAVQSIVVGAQSWASFDPWELLKQLGGKGGGR